MLVLRLLAACEPNSITDRTTTDLQQHKSGAFQVGKPAMVLGSKHTFKDERYGAG